MSFGGVVLSGSEIDDICETGDAPDGLTATIAHAMLFAPLRVSVSAHGAREQAALFHALPDVTVVQSPSDDQRFALELIPTQHLMTRTMAFSGLDPAALSPRGEPIEVGSALAAGGLGIAVSVAFEGIRSTTVTHLTWIELGGHYWTLQEGEEPATMHPCPGAELCGQLLAALPA